MTLVSYSKSVGTCLQAAEALAGEGVEVEVIDLRSLKPLDMDTVLRSVRRTGRLVVVHEAGPLCGVGAEVACAVAEQAFQALKAPVRRVTSADVPTPASFALEQAFVPQAGRVMRAVKEVMGMVEVA